MEKRVGRGALIAQTDTGTSLNFHSWRREDQPFEVIEIIKAARHPVDRVIMSHIDRAIFDGSTLLRLADTGCVIEFDLFGWENSSYPWNNIDMLNDATRFHWVRLLIDHGHLERILISHGICTRTRFGSYGGHGYQHIIANIVPLMKSRGLSESEITAIFVDNPNSVFGPDIARGGNEPLHPSSGTRSSPSSTSGPPQPQGAFMTKDRSASADEFSVTPRNGAVPRSRRGYQDKQTVYDMLDRGLGPVVA
jgi:hypothetical protein